MSAKTDHVRSVVDSSASVIVRTASDLVKLGLIVRRISVGVDGEVTVDIGGYEDPKAPHEPGQTRFRSYADMVMADVSRTPSK